MSQEQVGNADMAPESNNAQANLDGMSDDFFSALDSSVNGGILDEPSQLTSDLISDNTLSSPSEVQPQVSDPTEVVDVETIQKRYSDSSREARRLNSELQELQPYMPILDAMRDDPNLIMAEKLNLPEDFVFDADDAFATPKSDSAKVMGATIDGIVERRLGKALQGQKTENHRLAKEATFRQRHEMDDETWSTFVDFAKSKSLELDDIYYLMNRKGRDGKIADSTRREMQEKMREVQQQPGSLATAGGAQVEESPDDRVFEALLGAESELEKAFSI